MNLKYLPAIVLYALMFWFPESASLANEGMTQFSNNETNQLRPERVRQIEPSNTKQLGNIQVPIMQNAATHFCTDAVGNKLGIAKVIESTCRGMIAKKGTLSGGIRRGKWGIKPIP